MDSHYSRLPGWLGYNRVSVRAPTAEALKAALRSGATEPVFNGIYAAYRRLIERPIVSGAYAAGAFYFTLRDWLDGHVARLIGADGFEIRTGYERPLRDLLNIVPAVGVLQDFRDDKGVFGTGPQLGVAATYGAFSLGYEKMGTDAPGQVFVEYRRGF